MIRILLALATLLMPAPALARTGFELLTFSPGDSLWERFGHTALWLRGGGFDVVYSFGHGRFADPSFGYHYLRGKALFQVVAQPMPDVLERYQRWDRTIEAQRLRLPDERVAWLHQQLERAVTPPHNQYRYDQLYDNCSTRVRDLLDEASGGALRRAAARRVTGRTFRDYTLNASRGHWFAHWGLDLIGGPHQDLPVSGWEEAFVPEALKQLTLNAQTIVRGRAQPLSDPPRVLYARKARDALHGDPLGARKVGAWLSALLAALTLLPWLAQRTAATAARAQKLAGLAMGVSGLAMAVAGSMVLFLVLVSQVHDFTWNENIFVFCPADAMLATAGIAMLRGRLLALPTRLVRYLAARLALLLLYVALGAAGVFTQQNLALTAIAAVMLTAPLLLALRQRSVSAKARLP